jgi:hypothetical protein
MRVLLKEGMKISNELEGQPISGFQGFYEGMYKAI